MTPVKGRRLGTGLLAWGLAWVITAALLAAIHYTSRDPDSQLYAGISARLVEEPVGQWIAPQWWGFWNSEGPYCEHPVGMFVVPAALGLAGYPRAEAAYAVNALYQICCFALVTAIAAAVTRRAEARALGSLLQLLPIAFVFRVRANQEYAVLAGVLLALYATERARTRPVWTAGMLAGFSAVLLVKGVFAVMVPIVCIGWLVSRWPSRGHGTGDRAAWLAILAMPVAGALIAWGYESAYVHATGRSFLEIYRTRQLPEDAIAAGSVAARVAYTATWYVTRVVWYAFPWSLVAGAVAAGALRRGRWRPWEGSEPAYREVDADPPHTDEPDAQDDGGARAVWFACVTGVVLTAAFSLAHRKADRYIFPVYFLIGAAGAAPALRRIRWLRRLADAADRAWVPAALYVLLVVVTLLSSGLPRFTFWRT